jgi:glycerophosphoryl diester phosphodiesterase
VEARKQMPELEVYYLEGARDKRTRKYKNFTVDVLKKAKDANLTGVDLDFHGVTEELVKQCHDMGMKFWVWTVDSEQDVKRMARYGVDSITTNLCDRARRWVDEELK